MTFPAAAEPLTPQIEAYVLAHPACTAKDICAALGVCKNAVNVSLGRLRVAGKIKRLPRGASHPLQRWEAGPEAQAVDYEPLAEGAPKQVTVQQWAAPVVAPQHWLSALGL
jgi:predicted transcriptional regulator of viral defense system